MIYSHKVVGLNGLTSHDSAQPPVIVTANTFFHLAPLDFETHANLQKREIKGFTVFNQYVMPKLRKCKSAKLKGFTVLQCVRTRILLVLQLVPLHWILLALL